MNRLKIVALAVALAMAPLAGFGQALRITPFGFCSLGSLVSAVGITSTNCVFASFTGVIANGVLTASSVTGPIIPGQPLVGTGVPAGTIILGQAGGTVRGAGTYTVGNGQSNPSSTLTVGSEAMMTAGIPPGANYALVCAYTQNVNYRADGGTPTATVATGGQQIAPSSCIPAPTTLSLLQFIAQTAGGLVSVDFYLWQ